MGVGGVTVEAEQDQSQNERHSEQARACFGEPVRRE